MTLLAIALAFAIPPEDLAGTWSAPCHRTVLGTGTCQRLEVKAYSSHLAVYEVTHTNVSTAVVDAKHVFEETTTRIGPMRATLEGTSLSWTSLDGTVQVRALRASEGITTMVGPDGTWTQRP